MTKHTAKHQPTPHMTKSCPNTCLFSPHMTNTQPTFSSYQKPTCTRFFPLAILHFSKLHELHGHNMTICHMTNNPTIMLCSTNNDSASSLHHISHPPISHNSCCHRSPKQWSEEKQNTFWRMRLLLSWLEMIPIILASRDPLLPWQPLQKSLPVLTHHLTGLEYHLTVLPNS